MCDLGLRRGRRRGFLDRMASPVFAIGCSIFSTAFRFICHALVDCELFQIMASSQQVSFAVSLAHSQRGPTFVLCLALQTDKSSVSSVSCYLLKKDPVCFCWQLRVYVVQNSCQKRAAGNKMHAHHSHSSGGWYFARCGGAVVRGRTQAVSLCLKRISREVGGLLRRPKGTCYRQTRGDRRWLSCVRILQLLLRRCDLIDQVVEHTELLVHYCNTLSSRS